MQLQPFKAVLFDMDGVIADSEEMWNDIDGALMRTYGVEYAGEHKSQVLGKSFQIALGFYRDTFNIRAEIEEMALRRSDIAREFYAERIPIFHSVPQVLEGLKERGLKIALATSSVSTLARPFLQRHNIEKYFDALTTGEEVQNGKPNPDIYLLAARKVGVAPTECLVVEDALAGVQAGKSAGMTVAAIPDARWGDVSLFPEKADVVLQELAQLLAWLDRHGKGDGISSD
jgi:HAD superfamily hydrolase (TIGR01509 family)